MFNKILWYTKFAWHNSCTNVFQVCDERQEADQRCIDCEQNFCLQCSKAHLRLNIAKTHTLVKVTGTEGRRYLTSIGQSISVTEINQGMGFKKFMMGLMGAARNFLLHVLPKIGHFPPYPVNKYTAKNKYISIFFITCTESCLFGLSSLARPFN